MFSPEFGKVFGKLSQFTLVSAMVFVLFGCGGGKVSLAPEQTTMKRDGLITMNVEWIKDKKKKYDIRMRVHNDAKTSIIFKLGDMQCFRGERQGVLKHTFFNTGERTIDFRPGQMKTFQMVCDLGDKAEGPFKIVFGRIFDNPTNDGATTGKVLADGVEWKADDNG